MIILGIDVGKTGALVALDADTLQAVYAVQTDTLVLGGDYSPAMMRTALLDAAEAFDGRLRIPALVVIEAQQTRGKVQPGATSILTTGRGWGLWEGLVAGIGWPYQSVRSQMWTKAMGLAGADKDVHCRRAMELLPSLDLIPGRKKKPQDGLADAGLLALYGVRHLVGQRTRDAA